MRYVLICSPGGSGLKQAVEDRLTPYLRQRDVKYCHEDVEDVLCGSTDTRVALTGQHVPVRPNMGHVTHYLPRTQVVRLWKQSLGQALTTLHQCSDKAGHATLNLLSCHLDLYGGRRRELYSPIDIGLFREHPYKVTHVLLLIDDIYDMYVRLAKKAALYDEEAGLKEYFRKQGASSPREKSDALTQSQESAWKVEWKSAVFATLLAWRRAEMVMAEAVAHQLEAKYMVFAVKQSISAVANWLLDEGRPSVYISHPITRPREYRRDNGKWPPDRVVEACNLLQRRLDQHGVTCVMPTGIDELRFVQVAGKRSVPRLDVRWPVASDVADYSDTLFVPEAGAEQPELTHVLLEDGLQNDDTDWRPWMTGLINQIEREVAFRDHHLVANSPGLLVLRPFYNTGRTSHGVAAEVDHWRLLTHEPHVSQHPRRAAFIHFVDDVTRMLRVVRDLKDYSLDYQIKSATAMLLEDEGFSPRGMAQTVIRQLSEREGFDSLLDAGLIPTSQQADLRKRMPGLTQDAQTRVLEEQLTLIQMPHGYAGVWIVESEEELNDDYSKIAAFLRGATQPPRDWIPRALASLQTIQAEPVGGGQESRT